MTNAKKESKQLSNLKGLLIEPTKNTPFIRLDHSEGIIELKGRSSPQEALKFFTPLLTSIQHLRLKSSIRVVFNMDYFNTSSAKCIFQVFRELRELSQLGVDVEIDWIYEEYDEDMREVGVDLEELTELPFHFKIDCSDQ